MSVSQHILPIAIWHMQPGCTNNHSQEAQRNTQDKVIPLTGSVLIIAKAHAYGEMLFSASHRVLLHTLDTIRHQAQAGKLYPQSVPVMFKLRLEATLMQDLSSFCGHQISQMLPNCLTKACIFALTAVLVSYD